MCHININHIITCVPYNNNNNNNKRKGLSGDPFGQIDVPKLPQFGRVPKGGLNSPFVRI
jgi:hypothetical protein